MKVTFCAYDRPNYVGGPNAGLRRLLPALKERGVEPECLLLTADATTDGPLMQSLRKDNIPYVHTPYHKTTEERVRWIIQTVRHRTPDVFVPNLMPAAYFAAPHLKRCNIPSVGWLRSDDDFHWKLVDMFIRGRERDTLQYWVTVSQFLKDAIKGEVHRVERIPSSYEPYAQIAPPEPGQPFRILYTGRLVERQKRISLVTETLCRLTESDPTIEATILGDGIDRQKVVDILADHPNARVTLHPRVDSDRVVELLHRHHAILLMSEFEGLPLSFQEAMGAGLVPISTPVRSGIPELVIEGKTGFYLHNPDADLPEIVATLRDRDTFQQYSDNARALLATRFSPETHADKWADLLAEAAANREKKRPCMPLSLDLAPYDDLREDDRATRPVAVATAIKSHLPSYAAHPFLKPRCTPGFVDLYTVRTNILKALTATLPAIRGSVVDIGAGNAPYRNLILDQPGVTEYLGVDLENSLYALPDLAWDGVTLPLEDNRADTVMLTEVLEHCDDAATVLAEAHRILKPGGLLFLTVPFLWPLHDVPQDVCRYTPWTMERLLASGGFSKFSVKPLGGFDASLAQMVGLYARRRSRGPLFTRFARPVLSTFAAPLVKLLTSMDNPEEQYREGLMITGLWATATKQDTTP